VWKDGHIAFAHPHGCGLDYAQNYMYNAVGYILWHGRDSHYAKHIIALVPKWG